MRIRDNIVRMYAMMTGQTQEQITIVSPTSSHSATRVLVSRRCLEGFRTRETTYKSHHAHGPMLTVMQIGWRFLPARLRVLVSPSARLVVL